MIYVKLGSIINNIFTAMYYIKINDKTHIKTDKQHEAWSAYRATCRDYDNKSNKVTLLDDDELLHAKSADMMLLDGVDVMTSNDVLQAVMQASNIDKKQLKQIIKWSGIDVSNSRIDGWCRNKEDRKFVDMYHDDLASVMIAITQYLQRITYSPDNIKRMRSDLGLTQAELGDLLGSISGRQVRNWESGSSGMRADVWQNLINKWQNNM